MMDSIKKYHKTNASSYSLSILIPTWNNLPYLQLCINSIRKNTNRSAQIIVLVNEGKDGTLDWLAAQEDIDYIHATENIGICYGLNICRSLVKSDYIVYLNDDMYVLPNWESVLLKEVEQLTTKAFLLSATMIEPHDTGNDCVVVKDYGQDLDSFNESKLLIEYKKFIRSDWMGGTWPPILVHTDLWDLVGGLSIEFSPGMYSDPDFSRKLYEAGVRIFKGKGDSFVYHFGSKSTKRVRRNKGRITFLQKWGITSNTFMKHYLKLGSPYSGPIDPPKLSILTRFISYLKRMFSN